MAVRDGEAVCWDQQLRRNMASKRTAGVIRHLIKRILLRIDNPSPLTSVEALKLISRSYCMFVLDQRLLQDTVSVGDFPLCRLLLSNDSHYPWFILVPRRADISEIFQLSETEQTQLWHETTVLSKKLQQLFDADKMNVAALGNVVKQLHMHVIVRRQNDAAWPAPVWGKHPALPYSADQVADIIARLKAVLIEDFNFVEGLV
jgi:diadenosine tetraphosphate (Ap4A) HIT family hydrolase